MQSEYFSVDLMTRITCVGCVSDLPEPLGGVAASPAAAGDPSRAIL